MSPALGLMATYIVVTVLLQFGGYLVSEAISKLNPAISLMTFLLLFLGMFWAGWPIAVLISDRLIPETEQERERHAEIREGERRHRLRR